jgi:hypothetical protein
LQSPTPRIAIHRLVTVPVRHPRSDLKYYGNGLPFANLRGDEFPAFG